MRKVKMITLGLTVVIIVAISGFSLSSLQEDTKGTLDDISLPGATVLAFGPEQVLFIGDSKSGVVHAVKTEAKELQDPVPYNHTDFDLKIAEKLGIASRDLIVNDMKIHPKSQEAYLAVKKGHEPDAPSMIVIANPMNGEIRFLDVASSTAKVSIKNPASDELMFWREIPSSSLTITDMDYYDGHLYVAGLSNSDFASTLRKIPYPFQNDTQESTQRIEIYHAVHTQLETRAPIRTMAISEIDGNPTLIASYTCTPLVTIPLADIVNANAVKGKTIAELGYGNTPIDMITYMAQEQDGSFDEKLLITHKHRSGSLISMKDVTKAVTEGQGMAGTMAQMPTGTAGMQITYSPTASILHIDNQNQMMVAALKRNMETGGLDLVSELKGVFLRLSEFISEYDFPGYRYDEKQAQTKQFHDMIKPMEGYPELVSEKTDK